ncbi:MAG: phage holin family protein [Candidatus Faecousia sp.]|nr:phage holin family protein [Candidatus Faecousia sp.]
MEMLSHYITPVILGLCLVVGYLIKSIPLVDNRWIPIVVTVLGVALAVWMNWPHITAEVILGGAVSGLASTGMHQLFKQWIDSGKPGEGQSGT